MRSIYILFCIIVFVSCEQRKSFNRIAAREVQPNEISFDTLSVVTKLIEQVFPGEDVFGIYRGDLNLDDREDLVVVTEKECDSTYGPELAKCRRAFLLIQDGKQKYRIASFNNKVIDCSICGGAGPGDSFSDIIVTKGKFEISSIYGACQKTEIISVFVFNPKLEDWFLFEESVNDYYCHPNEKGEIPQEIVIKTEKDFGKITFKDYRTEN